MHSFNPVIVIPHYNHSQQIKSVLDQLIPFGLPIIVVDDGSNASNRQQLTSLQNTQIQMVFRPQNGGKGAAVKTGLQTAFEQGFSHAVQVDADGQHHLADIETMLAKSQQHPTAVICGLPIYGEDAPKARLYGRKITNFWLAVNTLSLDIVDGMCGFRLYPLDKIVAILSQEKLGDRMDFDIEILVHCHWRKIPLEWVKTPVKYESGGISHFRGWADNWLISKMHARLFFGMLARFISGKM